MEHGKVAMQDLGMSMEHVRMLAEHLRALV
jgi:hypothetical protein